MKARNLLTLALSALFFIALTSMAPLQGKWEHLGSRVVNYGLDKDVVNVGAHEGAFTKLKVVVKGGSLNMHKMIVHYANGSKQDIALKHNFSKNSGSRVIDLKGNKRIIKKIVFYYDTKNLARKRAKVLVFGRH